MNNAPRRAVTLVSLITLAGLIAPAAFAQQPAETPPSRTEERTEPSSEPTPEETPTPRKRSLRFGPEFGVFFPTSARTRNRFGQNWQQFGIGLGRIEQPNARGALRLDTGFLFNKNGDNRATVVPLSLEYRLGLVPEDRPIRPYIGVGAGGMLATLRSKQDGITSAVRGGWGGSAVLGATFAESGYIEATYRTASRIRGFDLSGAGLSLGYRF